VGTLTRIAPAAFVIAAAAVAAVLVLGRAAPVHGVEPVRPLTVRASFDPPAVEFGDRVVVRVVVLADRSALDTSRLTVTGDMAPLTSLGRTRISRATRGRLLVATYEQDAVCLSEECLAGTGSKPLRLQAARAEAPRRAGGVARASSDRRLLRVDGRVTAADLEPSRLPFRADTSPPAVSYRIAPDTLRLLLDVVAATLALAGVGFAAWQAVVVRSRGTPESRGALERAVALVREAESRTPDDRRRAVGLLARVLQRRDATLAHTAGDLAWSEPEPAPTELAALADRVGREVSDT
jgi:hypothetical protein